MARTKPVAVIDAETDPFGATDENGELIVPRPFVWGFYDGERFRDFATVDELLDFLRPQSLIVYAHNGGRFDYHFLLPYLEPYSEVLVINGRLAKFKIGECEFRDSVNILPIRLAEYKKDDIKYDKLLEKNRHKHMEEIKRYLRSDCVYLFELVSKFRAEYGSGLTLAGTALKYWQKLTGETAPQTDGVFYDQVAPYYYGGRVECFHSGLVSERFAAIDINSAYPFAMLADHPISTSFDQRECRARDPICPQSLYTVTARSAGAFPYRADGKLTFPHDDEFREYNVTGWELQAAIDTGTAQFAPGLWRKLVFGKDINFRQYVRHFYELKKAAPKDSPEYVFAKLFLNSLYGKFGANPENYSNFGIVPIERAEFFTNPELAERCIDTNPDDLNLGKNPPPWNDEIRDKKGRIVVPAGFYWKEAGTLGPWALCAGNLPEPQKRFYNLATAASITGFVRAYLWRTACAIKANGGRLLYCDTDSLSFVGELPQSVKIGKELGEWSDDGQFSEGAIGGKKLYAFKYAQPKDPAKPHKIASKGVRMTAAQVWQVAQGRPVHVKSEIPTFSVHKPARFVNRTIKRTADH